MGVKPKKVRSDLEKGQPEKSKRKEKSEAYLKYQKYIRSKEWKDKRDRLFEVKGKRCVCCGRTEDDGVKIHMHHNSYEWLYHEEEHPEIVVPVCQICHVAIHRNKNNFSRFNMK